MRPQQMIVLLEVLPVLQGDREGAPVNELQPAAHRHAVRDAGEADAVFPRDIRDVVRGDAALDPGLMARMTSSNFSSEKRFSRSGRPISSGPMPSIGEMWPCSTKY